MHKYFTHSFLLILAATVGMLGGCSSTVDSKYQPKAVLTKWDDSEWQTVLKNVVTPNGMVRYEVLKENRQGTRDALFRYVGQLGAASPDNRPELFPTADDKLAYWINAYNAVCLYRVVERGYPGNMAATVGATSPVFAIYLSDSTKIGGDGFTLDALEKGRVRSTGDARIHFALNCSSYSCPPLRAEPYTGAKLQAQLDDQGRKYLSDQRGVTAIDSNTVGLNDIFATFYTGDFTSWYERKTGKKGSLLDALKLLAAPDSPIQKATDYKGTGYNWNINQG